MKAVMYHYVRPRDSNLPNLHRLDINNFRKQLDFFETNMGFVSREKFISAINEKKPCNGVVLTFDDGLSCHYEYVFKELKRRNLWGIFYVPSGPFVNNKILDVHRIHILLAKVEPKIIYNHLLSINIYDKIGENKIEEFEKFTYLNQSNDAETLKIKRILNYFIDYKFKDQIIDELLKKFIKNMLDVKEFYLSIENMKEMQTEGMIIGSHTENHKVMSSLNFNEQNKEIINSFNFLENSLGKSLFKTFCYPYGGNHTFNKITEGILKDISCDFSFNVEYRDINEHDLKKRNQALPRYDCNLYKYGSVSKN